MAWSPRGLATTLEWLRQEIDRNSSKAPATVTLSSIQARGSKREQTSSQGNVGMTQRLGGQS
jgi:hypothetical protein